MFLVISYWVIQYVKTYCTLYISVHKLNPKLGCQDCISHVIQSSWKQDLGSDKTQFWALGQFSENTLLLMSELNSD